MDFANISSADTAIDFCLIFEMKCRKEKVKNKSSGKSFYMENTTLYKQKSRVYTRQLPWYTIKKAWNLTKS